MQYLLTRSALFGLLASTPVLGASCAPSCKRTCDELRDILPAGSVTTLQPLNFYWAQQQQEVQATCYTSPQSTADVSTIVRLASKYQCKFAIRGGGHSDVPGASNIAGGLVLSMDKFKQVNADQASQTVQIGAGNSWGDVYKTLDTINMTVAGGREESVGVAGLLLGGGLSHFSGTRGYACDNVKSFEAVLANGSVVQASADSQYADLHRALKGGGNNFAVVTTFTVDMFPYQGIWGGITLWSDTPQVQQEVPDAFAAVVQNAPSAPHAALFTAVSYLGAAFLWSSGLYYTLPEPQPAIFQPFYSANLTAAQLFTTRRIASHTDHAKELGQSQPANYRNQFTTATFAINADLHRAMIAIFKDEVAKAAPKIISKVGFTPGLSFQPLTENMLAQQNRRGPNVLGTDASEGPLMVVGFLWQWSSSLDDAVVLQGIQNVLDRSTALASKMGLFNEFIYQNYAAPKQQSIATYGQANVEFMRQVAKKYDAGGVFQNLVSGGFKLPQA